MSQFPENDCTLALARVVLVAAQNVPPSESFENRDALLSANTVMNHVEKSRMRAEESFETMNFSMRRLLEAPDGLKPKLSCRKWDDLCLLYFKTVPRMLLL